MASTYEVRMSDERQAPPVKVEIVNGAARCVSCSRGTCKHATLITKVRTEAVLAEPRL